VGGGEAERAGGGSGGAADELRTSSRIAASGRSLWGRVVGGRRPRRVGSGGGAELAGRARGVCEDFFFWEVV